MDTLPVELVRLMLSWVDITTLCNSTIFVSQEWNMLSRSLRPEVLKSAMQSSPLPPSMASAREGELLKIQKSLLIQQGAVMACPYFWEHTYFSGEEDDYTHTMRLGLFLLNETLQPTLTREEEEDPKRYEDDYRWIHIDMRKCGISATKLWSKRDQSWKGLCEKFLRWGCPAQVFNGKDGLLIKLLALLTLLANADGICYERFSVEGGHPY